MVNVVSPYRAPIYRALSERLDVTVLHGGEERNRDWDPRAMDLGRCVVRRVWGATVTLPRRRGGITVDWQRIHVEPGYLGALLRARPDVVISNEMGPRTWLAAAYAKAAGVPHFVWWGGTPHTEAEIGPGRRWARRGVVGSGARFISYGASASAYLRQLGVGADRVVQIQNCVDESRFSAAGPRETFGLPGPRLLYVGQLIRRKGLRELLGGLARLRARGVAASLALVGEGPERPALERRVRDLGLVNVRFCGRLGERDVARAYRGADAVVLPSLEEVWGLVVNEALLSGVPVLCSSLAGCARELLPEGCLFDPRAPREIDAALCRGIRGELRADQGRLWPMGRVVARIDAAVRSALA